MKRTRRYLANEQRLQNALHSIIASRNINVRVHQICEAADITRPTFYHHCADSNDALRKYEQRLEEGIYALIPASASRSAVISIFATFIVNHDSYFAAALDGYDHFLITDVVSHYRSQLVGEHISDSAFAVYVGTVHAVIFCWNTYDNFSRAKLPYYTAKLKRIRAYEI